MGGNGGEEMLSIIFNLKTLFSFFNFIEFSRSRSHLHKIYSIIFWALSQLLLRVCQTWIYCTQFRISNTLFSSAFRSFNDKLRLKIIKS